MLYSDSETRSICNYKKMIRVIILAKSLTTFENKLSLFPSDLNLREPLHVPKLNDFIASSPARVRDDRFFDQIKEELF